MNMKVATTTLILLPMLLCLAACGGEPRGGHGAGGSARSKGASVSAVPVEVAPVQRRAISTYIETNGTLEAEYEVNIVARVAAPIVELLAEEGLAVEKGQLLARLDDEELSAQLEISRVGLEETRLAHDRALELQREELISDEEFENAKAAYEAARARFQSDAIQVSYTNIRAPFDGLIAIRYVDFAENVAVGTALFRITDFTPLLCPIQIPERDISRLRTGQRAYLTVESWPGRRFSAEVLRISPVVDAATGTVKVTLEVDAEGLLRPGMFARVFVETESRDDALVIPKAALSLESIGDTVYVANSDVAGSRAVTLGFKEGDFVEALSGLEEGELVVVVGQDGLADGTPIRVMRSP
jgi:membrane fusion protein (multidrug efflux system)